MSTYTDTINQVIQNHQADLHKHFRRFGVHDPHHRWTHRDLWNGYRAYGSPFLNGLGTVLSSLFAGHAGQQASILNAQQPAAVRYPQLSTGSTEDIDEAPAISVPAGLGGYTGEYSNATGPDIRREDHHRNEWFNHALRGVVLPFPGYFETPWISLGDGTSPGGQNLPAGEDFQMPDEHILGIPRNTFIFLAIVLVAGFLWFKFRK